MKGRKCGCSQAVSLGAHSRGRPAPPTSQKESFAAIWMLTMQSQRQLNIPREVVLEPGFPSTQSEAQWSLVKKGEISEQTSF